MMRTTPFLPGLGVIAAVLVGVPAAAQTSPEGASSGATPAIEHGSGSGNGDSRGPGAGQGTGRRVLSDAPSEGEDVLPQKTVPKADATRSPLAIDLNDDFELTPSISYRVRYYHREGHDFVGGGVTNDVRHRARVGLLARYQTLAQVFVQLQDVRTYGEESDPSADFDADGFDLHQGYVTLSPTEHLRFRLGRQEVELANERLVGVPQFLERARSFDGLHVRYDDGVEAEAGYFLVRDYGQAALEGAPMNGKRHLGIAHLAYQPMAAFHPHVLGVLEGDTAIDRTVVTAGALVTGTVGDEVSLGYSAEGYYQGGAQGDDNVAAWLMAFSTRVTLAASVKPFAEAHAVLVSGDDDPDDLTLRTFASPFPRGHRIHGEMDFFINFPNDTDKRGLRDFGGTLGAAPGGVNVSGEFHFFDAMATRPDGLRHFGFETDLKVSYPFWKYASVDALYGFFVPGEIKRVALSDARIEHFVYTTAQVGF